MSDVKISELPAATSVNASDLLAIVQNGTTKKATANLIGTLLQQNIARVDPSGDDGIGIVGDLTKPFLTVQGAIDAIEAGSFGYPVIDVGTGTDEPDVTTSLQVLTFNGNSLSSAAFGNLSCTRTTGQVSIFLNNVTTTGGAISGVSSGGLTVEAVSSLVGDITSSAGPIGIYNFGDSEFSGILSAPGFEINVNGSLNKTVNIDSAGSSVTVSNSLVVLEAAASITLIDARIIVNNAGITPTYADILLNPAEMDFSSLPTSEPTEVGKAWIDTTGGLNIVKVHL